MKVAWIINITMPDACEALGKQPGVIGGWLTGYRDALLSACPETELHVIAPYWGTSPREVKVGNTTHHLFPQTWMTAANQLYSQQGPRLMAASNQLAAYLSEVGDGVQPDVVHLHGTEMPHALTWIEANGTNHTIASIQGLASEYAKVYMSGLTPRQQRPSFSDWRHGRSLAKEHAKLRLRGVAEVRLLEHLGHVAGRTAWDHDCALAVNPSLQYHELQEVLRQEFYEAAGSWKSDQCHRHTIFVSQSHYPIKGLHMLLEALPLVIRQFPDLEVRIVGNDLTDKHWWQRSTYGNVLHHSIEQYNLRSHLSFLGPLNAQQMIDEYRRANLFVCPSRIENSCNSVCEAQMIGTPVVAANVGGMSTLLDAGRTGLLYDFDDTEALAGHISLVLRDDSKAIELSALSCDMAQRRHEKANIAHTLYNIYKSI